VWRATDVYLKVELDLDSKEKPERVAAEICRTIRRIYGVRRRKYPAWWNVTSPDCVSF